MKIEPITDSSTYFLASWRVGAAVELSESLWLIMWLYGNDGNRFLIRCNQYPLRIAEAMSVIRNGYNNVEYNNVEYNNIGVILLPGDILASGIEPRKIYGHIKSVINDVKPHHLHLFPTTMPF